MRKMLRYLNKKRHEYYMGAKLFKLFTRPLFYLHISRPINYLRAVNSLTPTVHQLFTVF